MKFYLQWLLLIGVHLTLFWYFPTKANNLLQKHAYCDYENTETSGKCNEVRSNFFLWLFYLLYCMYFFFSALQVRFGLPELRKGNFTMQ